MKIFKNILVKLRGFNLSGIPSGKRKIGLLTSIIGLSLIASGQNPVQGNAGKQSLFVKLSIDESRANQDIKKLKNFDVAGVRWDDREVELIVDPSEFETLRKMGFQISFSPSDPGTDNNQQLLDGYLTPEGVVTALQALSKSFPEKVRVFEAGRTTHQRPILAVEISNHLEDPSKPVVFFNGMHHAREVMTTEVLVHMAQKLALNQEQDPQVERWLEHLRVIILPQVNPDGNALVHQGEKMWRKNAWVRQDRVTGVDLNRNYPSYWNHCNGSSGSPNSDVFRGPAPGSEPESKALMGLVSRFRPIASISYHSYGEMIIYPFGCSNVSNHARELFQSVGEELKTNLIDDKGRKNTYRLGPAPEILYEADGTDLDWQWHKFGVLAYTIEMNSQGFQPSFKAWRQLTVNRQEMGWRALLDRVLKTGVQFIVRDKDLSNIFVEFVPKKDQTPTPGLRWGLRSESGLVYNLLSPDTYEIKLFRGDNLLKVLDVEIKDDFLNLGEIDL